MNANHFKVFFTHLECFKMIFEWFEKVPKMDQKVMGLTWKSLRNYLKTLQMR